MEASAWHNISAGMLLAEIIKCKTKEEQADYAIQFCMDLISDKNTTAETKYGRLVIEKTRRKRALASAKGKEGAEKRWGKKVVNIRG